MEWSDCVIRESPFSTGISYHIDAMPIIPTYTLIIEVLRDIHKNGTTRKELATALKLSPSGVHKMLHSNSELTCARVVELSLFFKRDYFKLINPIREMQVGELEKEAAAAREELADALKEMEALRLQAEKDRVEIIRLNAIIEGMKTGMALGKSSET
jgi:plasmid maintenance system antidote protein VapI